MEGEPSQSPWPEEETPGASPLPEDYFDFVSAAKRQCRDAGLAFEEGLFDLVNSGCAPATPKVARFFFRIMFVCP